MRWLRSCLARVAAMVASTRRDEEIAAEIESHLGLHTQDNIARGMTPEAARRAAVLKLGNPVALQEGYRQRGRISFLDHLGQDVRYAGRGLRRSPGLVVVTLATVAIGIAGPTVMFTMMKAWILDPLPFREPGRLVDVRALDSVSGDVSAVNTADYLDWRRAAQSFEDLAGYRMSPVRLADGDRPEIVRGAEATASFFQVLGTQPALGRVFAAADADAGAARLAVVSHAMWRDRLGSDPALDGRTIRLQGEDYTVIGVLPDRFQFTLLGRVDVWRLLAISPEDGANRRSGSMVALGRLRAGRTLDQARSELTAVADRLARSYPDTNARRSVRVNGLADEVRLHHDAGFIVPVLFAMMICVLLVACVNVSSVMLARASTRRQEMAVRLALGASRVRIIRQWLVEHLLLFVAAGAIAAGLTVYGAQWITNAIPADNRQYLRNLAVLPVDWTVVVFAIGMGAACGLLFGWLPAWTGTAGDVNRDLRDGAGRASTGRRGTRLRSALVIGEVALSLALLIAAALLAETGRNVTRADVGFNPGNLVAFELSLDARQYPEPPAIRDFYERLVSELARRPGVAAAGAGSLVPFGQEGRSTDLFFEGQPDPTPAETPRAAFSQITPSYAETLELRLRRGRFFRQSDGSQAPMVAIVNETLAARYFAGRDPIGRRLRLRRTSPDFWTIVGVVADVKNFQMIDSARPQVYVPQAQRTTREMTVVVRSLTDPESLAGTIRTTVASLDPAEPVAELMTMEGRIFRVTGPYQVTATFVTFFGVVTLLLAGVGVYGVISYAFAQRTREIGIRMALGARRANVRSLVFGQIRTLLVCGLIPGMAMGWLFGQTLSAFLYGVGPSDWRLYLAMAALLSAVAVLAALGPARRATRIQPMTVLRE